MSLTSCRLWDMTATDSHKGKHYSQTVVVRHHIYANSAMSLTHWYQYHQIAPQRIWWQLTCASLSCSLAIWSITHLIFMWRHWNIMYLLMHFVKYSLFHMKATYLLVHLLPFICSYANGQFDRNTYPEMWKFCKNYDSDIIPCPICMLHNCQNMSEQSYVNE